jgi:hypothetical protein
VLWQVNENSLFNLIFSIVFDEEESNNFIDIGRKVFVKEEVGWIFLLIFSFSFLFFLLDYMGAKICGVRMMCSKWCFSGGDELRERRE